MRRLAFVARVGLVLAAMMLTAVLTAQVASAHATRVSAEPADNAVLATGPARVSATFNERLQTTFAAMTVVGPDGNVWSSGDTTVQGAIVGIGLRPLGPARHLHGELPGDVCGWPCGVRVVVVSADGGRYRHTGAHRRYQRHRRRHSRLAVCGGRRGDRRRGPVVEPAPQALTGPAGRPASHVLA